MASVVRILRWSSTTRILPILICQPRELPKTVAHAFEKHTAPIDVACTRPHGLVARLPSATASLESGATRGARVARLDQVRGRHENVAKPKANGPPFS